MRADALSELLEGSDLAAHCAKNGPLPLAQVEQVISQMCKALARAHERGIVHRDIKPQSIFLTNVGSGEFFVKVLDFGIAKASGSSPGMSSATKTGALMGAPKAVAGWRRQYLPRGVPTGVTPSAALRTTGQESTGHRMGGGGRRDVPAVRVCCPRRVRGRKRAEHNWLGKHCYRGTESPSRDGQRWNERILDL